MVGCRSATHLRNLLLLAGGYARNLIMNSGVSPFLSLSVLIHGVRGSVGGTPVESYTGSLLSPPSPPSPPASCARMPRASPPRCCTSAASRCTPCPTRPPSSAAGEGRGEGSCSGGFKGIPVFIRVSMADVDPLLSPLPLLLTPLVTPPGTSRRSCARPTARQSSPPRTTSRSSATRSAARRSSRCVWGGRG